jgi:hypothetical protein
MATKSEVYPKMLYRGVRPQAHPLSRAPRLWVARWGDGSEISCGIGKHIVIVKRSRGENTSIVLGLCGWHRVTGVTVTRRKAGFFARGLLRRRTRYEVDTIKKTRVPAGTGTLVEGTGLRPAS